MREEILRLGDLSEFRVILFKLGLFPAEMVVKDDLFLEVVEHEVADAVSLFDLVRESLVARLKLIKDVRVHIQVILCKNELTRTWILRLSLCRDKGIKR